MQDDERIARLRRHWDQRYALPGRQPLTTPHRGFLDWITAAPDDGPVLVIGDGEGRNARAVPRRHRVTMVELSAVAAETCRRLSRRPIDIVVADAFTWLDTMRPQWTHVAMLYLDPIPDAGLDALVPHLRHAQDAGGGFFIEMARVALPLAQQQRLCDALDVTARDVSRGDGVERIRMVG